jgi:hypothetical protein
MVILEKMLTLHKKMAMSYLVHVIHVLKNPSSPAMKALAAH